MGEAANRGVLIVGIGGLGIPAAAALVRAGVKRLGLIDPDPVELSNLPRQVIYGTSDIGTPKVVAAARRLRAMRPGLEIETYCDEFSPANAREMAAAYQFVVDATDSPVAKFLINDICIALGRPFVYGGVLGMTGQTMTVLPGQTACLRCIFEEPPDEAQAAQAITYLRGGMPGLAGMMLTYDACGPGRIRLTKIAARAGCGCGAAVKPPVTGPAKQETR
jgi:molybdopterin-synthase adenylyltransferase